MFEAKKVIKEPKKPPKKKETRQSTVHRFASEGIPACLARDQANQYSRNAIAIFLETGGIIGYVPEGEAREVATYLDSGFEVEPPKSLLQSCIGCAAASFGLFVFVFLMAKC